MGRYIRTGTSRGAHIRALYSALLELEELVPPEPSPKRVRLRNHRAALARAYPKLLQLNEVDLAQHLSEEDGEDVPDTI